MLKIKPEGKSEILWLSSPLACMCNISVSLPAQEGSFQLLEDQTKRLDVLLSALWLQQLKILSLYIYINNIYDMYIYMILYVCMYIYIYIYT